MPRGYRFILVAFVGWLALAQPEYAAAKPTGGSNNEVASALNNLASALQKPEKPSKHDEPCGPGENKRSSDLCAQWKAADAAKSAAQAAWWVGGLGALIGAFTLAIAWAAAYWAKKAADHTEAGAIEAKRGADYFFDSERGFVNISGARAGEILPDRQVFVALSVENIGNATCRIYQRAAGIRKAGGTKMMTLPLPNTLVTTAKPSEVSLGEFDLNEAQLTLIDGQLLYESLGRPSLRVRFNLSVGFRPQNAYNEGGYWVAVNTVYHDTV